MNEELYVDCHWWLFSWALWVGGPGQVCLHKQGQGHGITPTYEQLLSLYMTWLFHYVAYACSMDNLRGLKLSTHLSIANRLGYSKIFLIPIISSLSSGNTFVNFFFQLGHEYY